MKNNVKILLIAGLFVLGFFLNPGNVCAANGTMETMKRMNERLDRYQSIHKSIFKISRKKSKYRHRSGRSSRRSRHRVRIRSRRR